ncbi:MAG: hypothetical protein AAB757_01930 [Patescibacteria group bacterium]
MIKNIKRIQIGPVSRKILILLGAGLALGLTSRPDAYFKILKGAAKEWNLINERSLHEAIKKLYQSKMIDYKENKNGAVTMVLSEEGKRRILTYNLDNIEIKKPVRWDELWRVIIFDIPENLKKGRNALAAKLKQLGFYPMQKSVFIHPYECKDEIDFIVENFNLRPYVRYIVAKKTDIDLDLEHKFGISN